jgi:hypothetical protein
VAVDRAHLQERSASDRDKFSIGTLREEHLRGHGGERYKKRLGKWERPGKELEPWPKTGSARDAPWKLYLYS